MVRTFFSSSFSPFSSGRHRVRASAAKMILAPVLPPELLETIIDEVGRSNDVQTLRAFALVCSTLVHRAQSHLFRTVDLDKRIPRYRYYRRFHHLLVSKPHIGTYVRYIRLGDDAEDDYGQASGRGRFGGSSWIANVKTLPQTLSLLPRLEGFSLTFNSEMMEWNDLPASTRLALERVFSLPTLQGLTLEFMSSFPPLLLSSFSRLQCLGLSCVEADDIAGSPDIGYLKYSPKLDSLFLRGTPPSTINALARSLCTSSGVTLHKLSITPTFEPGFCDAINELINSSSASNLTSFEWLPSVHFPSSIGSIDLSRLRHLRSLKFSVSFRRARHGPLSQTLRLLSQLASRPNSVEEVALECYFLRLPRPSPNPDHFVPYEDGRMLGSGTSAAAEWQALDKLLSKASFGCLKEFKVGLSRNSVVEGDLGYVHSTFYKLDLFPNLRKRGVPISCEVQSGKDERVLLDGFAA